MNRIKELRDEKNLSQQEFASRLGITQGTVCEWEKGGRISHSNAMMICKEFDCDFNWLTCQETENNNPVGTRIAEVMAHFHWKQQDMALNLGVSQPTIGNWIEGKRKIHERSLRLISEKLNVNLDWLKTGEGEMFSATQAVQKAGTPKDLAILYGCDHRTAAFLERYVQLPDGERKQFNSTLSKLIFDKPSLDWIQRNNPR